MSCSDPCAARYFCVLLLPTTHAATTWWLRDWAGWSAKPRPHARTHASPAPVEILLNVFMLPWSVALRLDYEFMCPRGRCVCKCWKHVSVECISVEWWDWWCSCRHTAWGKTECVHCMAKKEKKGCIYLQGSLSSKHMFYHLSVVFLIISLCCHLVIHIELTIIFPFNNDAPFVQIAPLLSYINKAENTGWQENWAKFPSPLKSSLASSAVCHRLLFWLVWENWRIQVSQQQLPKFAWKKKRI